MKTELKQRDIEAVVRDTLKEAINELKSIVFPADYYMDIKSLSRYSGISIRKLKELIRHQETPLPAYKLGGSIRIKKSEFEIWMSKFRLVPDSNTKVDEIVADIMSDIKKSA